MDKFRYAFNPANLKLLFLGFHFELSVCGIDSTKKLIYDCTSPLLKNTTYLLSAGCAVDVSLAKRVLTVGVFGCLTH